MLLPSEACGHGDGGTTLEEDNRGDARNSVANTASLATALVAATAAFGQALPRPETWVDGEVFAGGRNAGDVRSGEREFDELYMCTDGTTFKDGVPLISDAGRGDIDHNGDLWHLNVSTGRDPAADSVEDLDLGDFTSTSTTRVPVASEPRKRLRHDVRAA